MFDSGSTVCLIETRVMHLAGLVGTQCSLDLSGVGGGTQRTTEKEVDIVLEAKNGGYVSPPLKAVSKANVVAPLPPVRIDIKDYDSLKFFKFTESYPQHEESVVDILLGVDVMLMMLKGPVVPPQVLGCPYVVHTLLGDVLGGAYTEVHKEISLPVAAKKGVEDLGVDFKAFMNLEDLGVTEVESHLSKEDEEAVALMKEKTSYDPVTKTYSTGLLWRSYPPPLDSNYGVAKMVAISSKKKSILHGKEEQVNKAYREQLDLGCAELVPREEEFPDHPVYCIPTHPVYKPDALSTKTRIVMNASSKCKSTGKSLNDCLYQGPTLLPDLVHILLNFRVFRYVTVCDISKMFWRIKIKPPDSDCLRFLWQWGKNDPVSLYRALSVTFGVISAPFQAIWTVLFHCDNFELDFPRAVEAVRKTLYMDDASGLQNSREEAVLTTREIYDLFQLASMQPHKWNSNDLSILEDAKIPREFWAEVDVQKILGLQWDVKLDTVEFDFSKIVDDSPDELQTKRLLIQQAAKIFDPTGLISPFTLKAKLLFQLCWKHEIGWDDPLPVVVAEEWAEWRSQIVSLGKLTQPRMVGCSEGKAWLAIFADASTLAYGACVYLVQEKARLIFSKTRVAPLKMPQKAGEKLTIARMELLASMIAVRVANYVLKALPKGFVDRCEYFTDSLITLYRIRNGPDGYKVWVANRLAEICNRSSKENWHFVPGQLNPADLASRSATVEELKTNELWWEGPAFLHKEKDQWPEHVALSRQQALDQNEVDKLEQKKAEIVAVIVTKIVNPWETMFKDTSRWCRLMRKTCWVIKFLCWKSPSLQAKFTIWKKAGDAFATNKRISASEIRAAVLLWLRWAQRRALKADILIDKESRAARMKEGAKLQQLQPYIDELGIVRTATRLEFSEILPGETKAPIVLPKGEEIIDKFVLDLHKRLGHTGPSQTLYYLRRQFRLIGGKREVSRIIHKCVSIRCKKPVALKQRFAPLPSARVDAYQAWSKVSTDLFGPINIRHECGVKNCPHPKYSKAWGVVFTCLATRAVHLECVADMSTVTFLRAFSRMCGRRGVPDYVWSDNAKTFKSANRILKHVYKNIDWNEVHDVNAVKGIDWRFGTEKAPHTNGVVERMVRSVKEALRTTMANCGIPLQQLETLLIEAEGLINDRPLVAPSEDDLDPLTITPSTLCIGRHISSIPIDIKEQGQPEFTRMQRYRKELMLKFWSRWRKDYLLGMQALSFGGKDEIVEVGQIVLLQETNLAKGRWKLARVLEVIKGRDGRIRRVKLKTKDHVVDRHVNQIALLEGSPRKQDQDELAKSA